MSLADLLECFDVTPMTEGPSAEWLEGHEAGLAEGRAHAMADATHLREEAARAVADLALTFEEARAHVLSDLAPLFAVLAEQVVPQLLHETLAAALLDELNRAAAADADTPLSISVAAEDEAALATILPLVPGAQVTLHPDARLAAGQIIIEGRAPAATSLDLARLERETSATLAALINPLKGQEQYG